MNRRNIILKNENDETEMNDQNETENNFSQYETGQNGNEYVV